jgi:hypothetical protein
MQHPLISLTLIRYGLTLMCERGVTCNNNVIHFPKTDSINFNNRDWGGVINVKMQHG